MISNDSIERVKEVIEEARKEGRIIDLKTAIEKLPPEDAWHKVQLINFMREANVIDVGYTHKIMFNTKLYTCKNDDTQITEVLELPGCIAIGTDVGENGVNTLKSIKTWLNWYRESMENESTPS